MLLIGTWSAEGIMASGPVCRTLKAEHMAAPTKTAKREESSCQLGAVHTWHKADNPTATIGVTADKYERRP